MHDPCGPSSLTSNHLDLVPFMSMKARLLWSHALIHATYTDGMPRFASLPTQSSNHSWLDALLKSTKTIQTGELFAMREEIGSTKSSTLVSSLWFAINPDWLSGSSPLPPSTSRKRLMNNLSCILHIGSRSDISLVSAGAQTTFFFAGAIILTSFHLVGMNVVVSE